MTPRPVLNYEYYTYIEMILMKSFSYLKVASEAGINCTPRASALSHG